MKHWWKILTLCLVGTVSAIVFTGCFFGPNLGASNHTNEEQATNEITDDTATDETDQPANNDIHDQINQEQQTNQDDPKQDTPSDDQNSHDTTAVDDNNQVTNPDENSTTNPNNNDNTTPNENESTKTEDTTTHEDPTPHQHTRNGNWQLTKAPTCTAAGQEILYCTECNEIIDSREIAATGHNYNHYVTEPTCTAGGYTTHCCSRCGDTYQDTYTDALGHKFVYTETTTSATCEATGTAIYTYHCGEQENRTIAAVGHDYTIAEVIAPTCTTQGYTEHTCSRCSASYKDTYTDINPQNHHYNEATHTCACGATDPDYQTTPTQDLGPIQNLEHTYWFFAEKNFVFLLQNFNAQTNSGTYCSYKGTYANGIFTKTKTSPYYGTFTIIPDGNVDSGYTIKFEDTYCTEYNKTNSDYDNNLIAKFTLTYVINTTNPTTYTLEGKFISNNYTNYVLTFIGDKAADEL